GLSAALHLAEAGTDVVLLEAGEPGWGASGRTGGQVIPGLKPDPDEVVAKYGAERGERLVEFAGGVAGLVFELIERHGIDCHAARSGWIQGVHARGRMDLAEGRVEQWSRRGAPVDLIDAARMAELTGTERYAGGWIDRRGGMLQPLSFSRGLARAAIGAGAAVHGGSPAISMVRGIEGGGQGWRVETPGGAVIADQVLLATNAYTDALWPGLQRSVIPLFSYQVATRPLGDNLLRSILAGGMPVSDTRRLLNYFRLDHTGRLVVGGRGRAGQTGDPAFYRNIVDGLNWLFPQLDGTGLDFFWAGQVALTLDHLPHAAELAPGLHAMVGYNGRGVAMATACGKMMAERMRGKPLADLPLPATRMKPIPFHGLRRPALAAAIAWKKMLDKWEARRG
ncbi:MAG: FAD-binding oxidoreductase, partial [Hyphomicrobiaceae bacterium]|nr:FAD-binding oxidoreductase [Hyphomicrobiaceae bacterium]